VLETVPKREESDCKKLGCEQPNFSSDWHTGLSGGAPDSVRCARLVHVNSPLSGFDGGVRLKITGPSGGASDRPVVLRTVRWCTGLSGESSAANSSLSGNEKGDVAIIHRTVRWCTGLSGEPTVSSTNGRPRNLRDTWSRQRSVGGTGLSGVHRTVSGAPTGLKLQRSTMLDLEGNRAPDRLQ
jgi:hypothetical protein